MLKNKTTQIIFQTVYCVLAIIGFLNSLGYFDADFSENFYIYYTNLSNYICMGFMLYALVKNVKQANRKVDGYVSIAPTFNFMCVIMIFVIITLVKRTDASKYHGELLASALYFPIVIPVIVLATSALGLTMAYVYGLIFAIAVFGIGISIYPICKYASVRTLYQVCRKKEITANALEGGLHILAISLLIFFVVSCIKPNASVNLQGKQNISTLPYDDALVYVVDEKG